MRWRPKDRKSTRLNPSHLVISYAVFCLKKKKTSRCCTDSANPAHCWSGPGQVVQGLHLLLLFFFNDTATTEIYTLSLHDALPIWFGHGEAGLLRFPNQTVDGGLL